jgi:flagellar basal body-associated protein FliL
MAEEVKNTTAGDAPDDGPGQGKVQDAKVVDEKGAENAAVEGDAGTVAPDEEMAGKGGTDAGSASSSASEGVEGEPAVEEKVVAEGETEAAAEAAEEVSEEKGAEEKVAEAAEGQTEEDTAGEGEPADQEAAAEEVSEKGEPVGEETVVAEGETEAAGEAAEEASGEEGSVSEEEGEAGLVSSEELSGETEAGVADEEWVVWKKEFINRFQKRFDKKWVLPGIGVFVVLLVIAGFFMVPGLRFADTGEVKFLEEIAGPVCDMKFFLPLSVDSGKKRFVKVTVVIELVDKGYKKEIDKKVAEIRDEVSDLVLAKSPQEVKSSKGKELLRKEITAGLNKYLAEDCVKNTYFTELIVL